MTTIDLTPVADAIVSALAEADVDTLAEVTPAVLAARIECDCDGITITPTVGDLLSIGYALATGDAEGAFDALMATGATPKEMG